MKKLILIDGNSLLFRAYYATAYPGATLMKTSKGQYTNALFAFINMIDKIKEFKFDHILVAFDTGEPTFRHKKYDNYKAGRADLPEELETQFPLIYEYLKTINFNQYSLVGYEADDIIGTFAKKASLEGFQVEIFSSDKDLLQLVNDNVAVNLLKKGMKEIERFTPDYFQSEFGFEVDKFIDYKALMGDPSDNIPGVPGVGPKTATKLIVDYSSIDNIYQNLGFIKGTLKDKLSENKSQAYASKELVSIFCDIPTNLTLDDLVYQIENPQVLIEFYQKYELHSLARTIKVLQVDETELTKNEIEFKIINSELELEKILEPNLSLYLEMDNENYHLANIWGLGISNGKKNYYVSADLFLKSPAFKVYIENEKINKITYDLKSLIVKLKYHGLKVAGFSYDLLLAAYLVDSHIGKEELARILLALDYQDVEYDELVYGKGVNKAFPKDLEKGYYHIANKAHAIYKIKDKTLKLLKENKQIELFENLELPLTNVLANMEYQGLMVNYEELLSQEKTLIKEIGDLEEKIHFYAGENFNISSPKQLGVILFETLGLKASKKTKTGYSTDMEVLEKLKYSHPIIPEIIAYRQTTKLYQTYIKGLKEVIYADGKVHTIYQQALTTTGRLSSIEPNLQNIPVRTKEGREIRKIFIPSNPKNYLMAIDYSQIELRVLAHLANSKKLIDAFNNGLDIHTKTAQDVFKLEHISPDMRRSAKAVNFGIIYGISAWSLSLDLNISVKEAETYIENYLNVYPEVKNYMSNIINFAKENNYVETIMNRRRYLPEINSKVYQQRLFGERLALNAPIQGSAADILKKAIIDIANYLKTHNKKTTLLLQVHDELILEVPADELEEMEAVIPKLMSNAVRLNVNLDANLSIGKSWFDL